VKAGNALSGVEVQTIKQTPKLQYISVIAKFATTASDDKIYQVEYYNLDMIFKNCPQIKY